MRMRELRHIFLTAVCIVFAGIAAAQTNAQLTTAVDLFNKRMYQNSLSEFNRYIRQNGPDETAEGYKTLCAIYLGQSNSDGLVRSFAESYPSSPMLPEIKFRLAVLDYENGDFKKAAATFGSLDPKSLDKDERGEFYFRKGYCEFKEGMLDKATDSFMALIGSKELSGPGVKSKYALPAKYYLGYIKYLRKDFRNAIPLFTQSAADVRFTELSKFYNLDCYFMLGDYDYVTERGPELFERLKGDNRLRAARMISESFYAGGDAGKAMTYFKEYTSEGRLLTPTENFFGGMIAYKLDDYQLAASYFTMVSDRNDSLAQSANYHLGECYVHQGDKSAARNAFGKAAGMKYDRTIEEDAAFNFAKLEFDLTGDASAIERYLAKYRPATGKADVMYGYIAAGSIRNKDYDKAIDAIKKIRHPGAEEMTNLKKAYLFKGMGLIDKNPGDAAVYLLKAAEKESYNIPLSNLAKFWLAECYYRVERYTDSQRILSALQRDPSFRKSGEYADSYFNNGYNYFKLKELQKAEKAFTTYVSLPGADSGLVREARMRIADCRFMERDFEEAIKMYGMADGQESIYPLLQSAIAMGLMSDYKGKIELLEKITVAENREKPLYTEALYELGRTRILNSDNNGAEKNLLALVDDPVDSLYYSQALLELGMMSSNKGKYAEAESYYKRIIEAKPDSPEAQAALNALENLSQMLDKPEEFLAYVKESNATAGKTDEEAEDMIFNSAEQIYLAEKWQAASEALREFTAEYPSSRHTAKAAYYLADSYRNLKDLDRAAESYKTLIDYGDTPYRESALINYAEILYGKGDYEGAAEAYSLLSAVTASLDYKIPAVVGQVRCAYNLGEFGQTIELADEALQLDSIAANLRQQILYMKSKSLIGSGKDATETLALTAENASTREGSEAAYLMVFKRFENGDAEGVEKLVFELSGNRQMLPYWLAKAFIVLGDSYIGQGNKEKALATYRSVRDNYRPSGDNDDIRNIAAARIKSTENR